MKKSRVLTSSFFTLFSAEFPEADPVSWQCSIEKMAGATYQVTFEAILGKNWHMFSQSNPKGGAAPLKILLLGSEGNYSATVPAKESQTVTQFNEIFGVNETFFIDKAKIQQLIEVTNPQTCLVLAELRYQLCNEVCIPKRTNFEFDLQSLQGREIS